MQKEITEQVSKAIEEGKMIERMRRKKVLERLDLCDVYNKARDERLEVRGF